MASFEDALGEKGEAQISFAGLYLKISRQCETALIAGKIFLGFFQLHMLDLFIRKF